MSTNKKDIWYYQIPTPEGRKKYTKTKPMEYFEFEECLKWWSSRSENCHAWAIKANDIIKYDSAGKLVSVNLDIKNPNSLEAMEHKDPQDLLRAMMEKEVKVTRLMAEIKEHLLKGVKL